MKTPCPRCGGPSEEGLCDRCTLESMQLLSCPDVVEVTVCSVCGAKLVRGRWQISERPAEEIVSDAVSDAVCIHKDLDDAELDLDLRGKGATRYLAVVGMTGRFRGVPVEANCTIDARVKLVACDRCSRLAGKYFESTVQIRGSRDEPTEREAEAVKRMAVDMADAGYRSGDQLSFIQEIKDTRGGVDLILGSTQLGRQIARAVSERFGGRVLETSKLVGQRDGKDLYRSTLLVRFPRLRRGDIIFYRGVHFEVTGFDGKKTMLTTLGGGRRAVIAEDEAEKVEILGNRSEALRAIVVTADEKALEIMDPESYKTVLAPRPRGMPAEAGEEVEVVRTGDGFIVLG